jgi:hypothetical protein
MEDVPYAVTTVDAGHGIFERKASQPRCFPRELVIVPGGMLLHEAAKPVRLRAFALRIGLLARRAGWQGARITQA